MNATGHRPSNECCRAFSYYGVQFHRGDVKEGFPHFPWGVGVTDLPHCPSCDHIGLSSPILEVLVLSALVFGLLSLPQLEVAKTLNQLYPELRSVGGLGPALQEVLRQLGSDLTVRESSDLFLYASVNHAESHSQVAVAAQQRSFLVDFWHQGVKYVTFRLQTLWKWAVPSVLSILKGSHIRVMAARFQGFEATADGIVHEKGNAAEFVSKQWDKLERWLTNEPESSIMRPVLPLLIEAKQRHTLRQLLPFTSMNALHFSRTTGFPYTSDCPHAYPLDVGHFCACSADKRAILGEGDVARVVDLVVANLPQSCGPAVHGTAETVKQKF